MQQFPEVLSKKLLQRIEDNALRKPGTTEGLTDFSSNDYLGLAVSEFLFEATHKYLIENKIFINGSSGSRLVTGNHQLYAVAEDCVAKFHEAESALIYNSGYDANVGFFSCVPQKGDVVLYDEYIHASIRDGLSISRALAYKFSHNDKEALYKLVERHRFKANELYIVTESVFSMDGDTPNLHDFADIAKRYKCRLVVDEAHATGVLGNNGKGLVPALDGSIHVFARLITFGKAIGAHGAAILGSAELTDYLINFSRSFIYTTALPPHALATVITSYNHINESVALHDKLHRVIMYFKEEAERLKLDFILSFSAIHCIIIPGNERVKQVAEKLNDNGFSVKAILSPTVPKGEERLRFCLHAFNTEVQITNVLELLAKILLSP